MLTTRLGCDRRDGARFGRRDIGQAVHAGVALGQARAIYTLHALTETPVACVPVAVAGTGASQLLAVASITRLTPWHRRRSG
jgi:hypothetical protein